jgi:hypothetical protein
MLSYLRCIKSHRGSNDPECRDLSKSYLSCRMERYVPYNPFVILPQPHNATSAVCPAHKGGEDLVKPSCQSHWDQVIGSSCLDAEKGCKGEVLHPSPLPLGRSENGSVVESEYFLPLQSRVRPSLTRTACLRKYPHIHFLPSHCFGSIRMKLINS